jgi:hypothetical protein
MSLSQAMGTDYKSAPAKQKTGRKSGNQKKLYLYNAKISLEREAFIMK